MTKPKNPGKFPRCKKCGNLQVRIPKDKIFFCLGCKDQISMDPDQPLDKDKKTPIIEESSIERILLDLFNQRP